MAYPSQKFNKLITEPFLYGIAFDIILLRMIPCILKSVNAALSKCLWVNLLK